MSWMASASWVGSGVKVDRDTLNAGVSSYDLSKAICGCARTIAAAVELLLLTHPHAAIARCRRSVELLCAIDVRHWGRHLRSALLRRHSISTIAKNHRPTGRRITRLADWCMAFPIAFVINVARPIEARRHFSRSAQTWISASCGRTAARLGCARNRQHPLKANSLERW